MRRRRKLIWLALRNITGKWARATPTWRQAMNQFAILYGDRFTPSTNVKCLAHGRCRSRGRPERAHRSLEKPPRPRFPTAPTRLIALKEKEEQNRRR
jgi:hypothetical protein